MRKLLNNQSKTCRLIDIVKKKTNDMASEEEITRALVEELNLGIICKECGSIIEWYNLKYEMCCPFCGDKVENKKNTD